MVRNAPAAVSRGSVAGAHLATEGLAIFGGPRELVSDLTLQFTPGQFVAVLGRNGSGKTLTLHTFAGLLPAARGQVQLGDTPISRLRRRAVARQLGLLTQDLEDAFSMSALESVLIGRHPHLEPWQWEGMDDERIACDALARVGLGTLADRNVETLSGGEQRRVAMAALLAQEPDIFLLDEPTNHLDPLHQLQVLGLFRALADEGRTVIATLHDPTLAARFADRVVLLFGDGRWRAGPVREALTAGSLSELYVTPMLEASVDGRRVFVSA
jgi:iron complex transport system ATP-binding protein